MKIKQLFTSFLACMALWSAPVYAKGWKKSVRDVHWEYNNNLQQQTTDYEKALNAIEPIEGTDIEQLKKDWDQKLKLWLAAKDYNSAVDGFMSKFYEFLENVKNELYDAEKETKKKKKKKIAKKIKKMLKKLVHGQDGTFKDWVDIDSGEINTIKPKDGGDAAIATIKTLYNQMLATYKSHTEGGAKKAQRDADKTQYDTDSKKASAAYDDALLKARS